MEEHSDKVPLPPDFLKFIRRNYEIIQDIKGKIKQFESTEEKLHKHYRGRFNDGYRSFDSNNSSDDIVDIISARVVPKVKLVNSNYDTIEITDENLKDWIQQDEPLPPFDPHAEELAELMHKFPHVILAGEGSPQQGKLSDNKSPRDSSINDNNNNFPKFMTIQGIQMQCMERARAMQSGAGTPFLPVWKHSRGGVRVISRPNKVGSKTKKTSPEGNVKRGENKHTSKGKKMENIINSSSSKPSSDVTLSSATIHELTLELYKRYYTSSNLQLTLPPLHSSVLTLLGQRPAANKPSPRPPPPGQEVSPGTSGRKKLRRHGRKIKGQERKDSDRSKRDSSVPSTVQGDSNKRKEVVDDPHDTQMSAMSHNDDEDDDEEELPPEDGVTMESSADIISRRLQAYIEQSARSLHEVLDEQLVGTEWNSTEMQCIDSSIEALKEDFKKYETKFKAGNIRIKEDLWLSLPRTWSRSSATFGLPTDVRVLGALTPLEYIQKYIFISEPRKLLYSLVFHRYRTMENPTGKTITYKTAQRALNEVLGRSLSPEEASTLQGTFLGIHDEELETSENLFRCICAVSERIFGKYSLEDCHECYACLKYKGKDKNRCHKNQKDQIERVDFEYVAARIRDGRVNPQLAKLLQTVFDRG